MSKKKVKAVVEENIDPSGISDPLDWRTAERGMFYLPAQQPGTLRVDIDVLAWFKGARRRLSNPHE